MAGFGKLLGYAQRIGAALHLRPDIGGIDPEAVPKHHEMIKQIGAPRFELSFASSRRGAGQKTTMQIRKPTT